MTSYLINQFWVSDSRRIDRYLIRSSIQQSSHVIQFVNSSPNRKRDTDVLSYATNQLYKCFPPFKTGCYIQKHQFVSTLFTIHTCQFYRIASMTQVYKISSFYSLPVLYIKTGNNSFS